MSELIVLAIRPEDVGTFVCTAQNPAGVARANFTVRVLDSLEKSGVTSAGGLQESTDLLNLSEESGTATSAEMFKVEQTFSIYLIEN